MTSQSRGLDRSPWDTLLAAVPFIHGAALLLYPSIPLIAAGMWWTANTCAHNFIHRPFFHAARARAGYSLLLSVVMGIPQELWRQRHLAHHANSRGRLRLNRQLGLEAIGLGILWTLLIASDAVFLTSVYAPGWLAGLALCTIQGHYEHAGGATSHYGRFYNVLCFNDGFHAEHHAQPGLHWTQLPEHLSDARSSRWPALLRWLEPVSLDTLERAVLRSRRLQQLVLAMHRRAFVQLVPYLPPVDRVAIVGGGLFPRTALILRQLLPNARILIIDANQRHLEAACEFLAADASFECRRYPSAEEAARSTTPGDLIVFPLAFRGDRDAIYRQPPAAAVIVHDWIWRRRGCSRVVSLLLLKRLNLLTGR